MNIKNLLSKTYKLEGLLMLAESRGEDVPDMVMDEIRELADEIQQAVQLPVEEFAPISADDPDVDVELVYDEEEAEEETAPESEITEPEAETVEEETEETEVAVQQEEQEDEYNGIEILDEEEFETEEPEQDEEDDDDYYSDETEDDSIVDEDTPTESVNDAISRNNSKDLRRAFSLNDKFRFRRELFSNSEVAMTNAINMVQAMNSYDEAEEYFFQDLGWDAESEEVKDFMSVIQKHFT